MNCENANFPLAICHWDLAFCGDTPQQPSLGEPVDPWPFSWQHQLTAVLLSVMWAPTLQGPGRDSCCQHLSHQRNCWPLWPLWFLLRWWPRGDTSFISQQFPQALTFAVLLSLQFHRHLHCWKEELTIRWDGLNNIDPFKRTPVPRGAVIAQIWSSLFKHRRVFNI